MTWGGLRGGISIALVLSLVCDTADPAHVTTDCPLRETLLPMTYATVLFSLLVQGLTLPRVIQVGGWVGG